MFLNSLGLTYTLVIIFNLKVTAFKLSSTAKWKSKKKKKKENNLNNLKTDENSNGKEKAIRVSFEGKEW